MSYKERLLSIKSSLWLTIGRLDLTYFFKSLHGFYNLNVLDFVPFANHTRTSHCKNPLLVLKASKCKTSTFQSFFDRIGPLCRVSS